MCQALVGGDDIEENQTNKVSVKVLRKMVNKKKKKKNQLLIAKQFLTAARKKIK